MRMNARVFDAIKLVRPVLRLRSIFFYFSIIAITFNGSIKLAKAEGSIPAVILPEWGNIFWGIPGVNGAAYCGSATTIDGVGKQCEDAMNSISRSWGLDQKYIYTGYSLVYYNGYHDGSRSRGQARLLYTMSSSNTVSVNQWQRTIVLKPPCPYNAFLDGNERCTCDTGFMPDSTATSCVPGALEKLTITLLGGGGVEPWHKKSDPNHTNANLRYKAIVIDQNGQAKANMSVSVTSGATENSGGHGHNGSRPKGKLVATPAGNPAPVSTKDGSETITGTTDGSGVFSFAFGAEEASGEHTLTATCASCSAPATAGVTVKVDGLLPIPASPFYTWVGSTNNHSDNHFLIAEATSVIRNIAVAYQIERQFKRDGVAPLPLGLNDASLIWGGSFDIDLDWMAPHVEHKRGTVIDIRANANVGSVASAKFSNFVELAAFYGADAKIHSAGGANQHFHVRLLGRGE